jgi:hypothetical protein
VVLQLNRNILEIWGLSLFKRRKLHLQGTQLLGVKQLIFTSHKKAEEITTADLKTKSFPYGKRHELNLRKKTRN